MGQCGCMSMWKRYTLPAPKGNFYLISLIPICKYCDGSSAVRIELIKKGSYDYDFYNREYHTNGKLPLIDYGDNKGNEITTGYRQHEFIKALVPHLMGIDSHEFNEDTGKLDEISAEVILEEMYQDACVAPKLIENSKESV